MDITVLLLLLILKFYHKLFKYSRIMYEQVDPKFQVYA